MYDGDWKDYNTGLFFAHQMSRLRQADIRVFLVSGNHDAASRISKSLKMPDNVHRFSNQKPETVVLKDMLLAVHGQGFARRDITENLAAGFPPAVADHYNIGMLHTCLTGREGHEAYAPCHVNDLIIKGYDYWALGHVHKWEVVRESPWIVFPGNLQGRHIKESGPKGCALVSVEDDGSTRVTPIHLDEVRWTVLQIDCLPDHMPEDVVETVRVSLKKLSEDSPGLMLAVRIVVSGPCPANAAFATETDRWVNQIRLIASDLGLTDVWVEKVIFHTTAPVDVELLKTDQSPLGQLLKTLDAMATGDEAGPMPFKWFDPVKAILPQELSDMAFTPGADDPEAFKALIADVRQTLLSHLLKERGSR